MDTADLVHDPEENRVPLQKLRFLLGRFRGEGRYTKGTGVFYKETRGTWEAGGRFIGLRMNVTYPLADGRRDIHEAFVMVGAGSTLASFEAQAYTDGGIIMNYHLECDGNAISFADRPPTDHGSKVQRARKHLTPTAEGFEERVDIDLGNGDFVPYSIVRMQRVGK